MTKVVSVMLPVVNVYDFIRLLLLTTSRMPSSLSSFSRIALCNLKDASDCVHVVPTFLNQIETFLRAFFDCVSRLLSVNE